MTGLTAFDLDGTLVRLDSSWRWIHHHLGTLEAAKVNADLYYSGKIGYARWAELDVRLWHGVQLNDLQQAARKGLIFIPGAPELVHALHEWGIKTAIISSGLTLFTQIAQEKLEIDVGYANRLLTNQDGQINGVDVVVGLENKHEILQRITRNLGIPLSRCAAIGDSHNDIPMFQASGASIAFNPSHEDVASKATEVIRSRNLLDTLPFLKQFFKIPE
jgi:phosphoserine phosphatase